MNSAQRLYLDGKNILETGGIGDTSSFEAACLFTHFYGISKYELPFYDKEIQNPRLFLDACKKRADGYPIQYIIGSWEFYGIEFKVSPEVLIPRADTETLIDYVLQNYSGDISILDMCCGSGCIGLTLKKMLPEAKLTLCDISSGALGISKQNAAALGAEAAFFKTNLLDGYEKYFQSESFDIIISNPPYIKSGDMHSLSKEVLCEPHIALDGGADGMTFYTALCEKWQGALKEGGELILESGYDTAEDIATLMTELCYGDVVTRKDLNGITRLVAGKKPK